MSSSDSVPIFSHFEIPNLEPLTFKQEASILDSVVARLEPYIRKFGTYPILHIYDTPFNGPRGNSARMLKDYLINWIVGNDSQTRVFHYWTGEQREIPNQIKEGLPAYTLVFCAMTPTKVWIIGECDFMEINEPAGLFSTAHIRINELRLIRPESTEELLVRLRVGASSVISCLFRGRIGAEVGCLMAELRTWQDAQILITCASSTLSHFPRIPG